MSGVVPVIPRFKFLLASGAPAALGWVTVYLAGTTDLATTYQDKTLSTENTNPIHLDANGECLLWVDSASTYKILLQNSSLANVSGYPVDNIPGAADLVSAAAAAAEAAVAAAQPYVDDAETAQLAAEAAQAAAEAARDTAIAANSIYATTAKALSKGVSGYASLVAGSGGTNGTFDLAFSGGAGSGAAGRFVVAGGVLTTITITAAGDSYTSAPTISFAASSGLAGASATAVIANNIDSGEYFYVPSANADESLILYKNNAGSAEEVKRYPSTTMLAAFGSLVPTGYSWAVLDGDASGRAAIGVTDDGTFTAEAMEVTTINGQGFDGLLARINEGAVESEGNFDAEIVMVLSYGQSLATGTSGLPVISTSQRFDNLRFAGGVRSQDSATPYTSLVSLIETDYLGSMGETPITGATDMVKELIDSENQLAYTDHTYQMLGSAPGSGGSWIALLESGQSSYTRFMADVAAGYSLSQTAGKTFKVPAFFWTQGESDYQQNTTAAAYKTALIGIRDDVDADTKAITGQTENVKCISYQTQAHATYGYVGNAYIAAAQLQVSQTEADHYVACPLYPINNSSVHLTATEYKKLGAYYGLAYKRIVVDGVDWKPVSPIETNRQGALVLVRFHVPEGILVLDTGNYALQTNYGFSLVTSAGVAITISAVAITGPDTVKITAATSIAAGAKLRYGYTNGGNLRDQQGDSIIFAGGGLNYAMHNWCAIFEETLV